MVQLIREVDKALSNPIWEQVRRIAPWESAKAENALQLHIA
jgi:nitrogenase molybdenum-cofactor synthesis protein NifE